jgi:hypothetical protein
MIELEPRARLAALTSCVDPAALQAITLEHCAASGVGHARGRRISRRAWPARRAEALLHQLLEQQIERPLDDRRDVAARIAMAHQIARLIEFVFQGHACRKLHTVARFRQRLDPWWRDPPWRGLRDGHRCIGPMIELPESVVRHADSLSRCFSGLSEPRRCVFHRRDSPESLPLLKAGERVH